MGIDPDDELDQAPAWVCVLLTVADVRSGPVRSHTHCCHHHPTISEPA
jgi:hypothetical protein